METQLFKSENKRDNFTCHLGIIMKKCNMLNSWPCEGTLMEAWYLKTDVVNTVLYVPCSIPKPMFNSLPVKKPLVVHGYAHGYI